MSAPITFKYLQLRNFLSFGNQLTEVDLTYQGSILIQGENLDANSNNGAGKTTLINALCYAIYNKPFDSISLQRLINSTNSARSTLMEVRLGLTKGDDDYEIYRCRGEQTNIQITRNGEDITLDSVQENDALIEGIVGISYELFTKIIIFSGNSTPFLQLPVHPQRQLIEELFNITLLTEKAVKLKELIRGTENSILTQEAIIKEQEGAVNLYNKQLKEAQGRRERWEAERAAQLQQLTQELELLAQVDMALERELHGELTALEKSWRDGKGSLTLCQKDERQLSLEVSKLTGELEHLQHDRCPYCLQQYADAPKKLREKAELLQRKGDQLTAVRAKLDELEAKVDADAALINEIKRQLKFDTLGQAITAEANAEASARKIEELTNASNPHEETLVWLERHHPGEVSYAALNQLRKELEHQQFLLKLLTDKNSFVRRRIINRTIPFLNARLASYTKQLGLPHVVRFDDDMSCTVSEYGRELDFGNLSSGEKKRVNLSLSLAFRDVLHHLHSKVNCLFIDEIDASLDSAGVDAVFRLLKQKVRDEGLGLWIISHRPEAVGRFDRTVVVRKENGFSRLVDHDEEAGVVDGALAQLA